MDAEEARAELDLELIETPRGDYDAVILAVGHDQFRSLGADAIRGFCGPDGVLYDATYSLPSELVDGRL